MVLDSPASSSLSYIQTCFFSAECMSSTSHIFSSSVFIIAVAREGKKKLIPCYKHLALVQDTHDIITGLFVFLVRVFYTTMCFPSAVVIYK